MEKDVREMISAHNIVQGKTPASCSGKTQSSDVMHYFNVIKKQVKSCTEVEDYFDATLDRRLRAVITGRASKFSSEKTTKIVHALMKIVKVTADVRRPSTIRNGYKLTGMYPVSFEKAMSQCQRSLSEAEYKTMEDAVPLAMLEFRDNGFISEEWMNERGIVNVNPAGTMAKDEKALHQQRAVIFNHATVQEQWDIYQTRHNSDVVELAAAQKLLEKEEAAAQKRIEKEAAALAEKERKQGLSAAEKKAESQLKKDENMRKKQEKELEKAAKVAQAKALLGRD